ncbi:cell division protein ZapA [Zavarzinia sp.]|uniref:cell division protein ZapA n=1 Tax=Zavarzinia sp. TaxID=2027920 RepID=UPI003562D2A9
MRQITVTINGRDYLVGCQPGDEAKVGDLADYLQSKVASLNLPAGAQVAEAQVLLLAALLTADDLSDRLSEIEALHAEVEQLRHEVSRLHHDASSRITSFEARAAQGLEKAAARVEQLVARFEPA